PTTIKEAIGDMIAALQPADPDKNPVNQVNGVAFDAGSNWLFGTQLTLGGTIGLSVVFNDPQLYGLLITMSGAKAGGFNGLEFEITYRKVSDTIGVYHIDLQLPDMMRHLEFGEVSITLPNISLDVYTNGNFYIDVGFPPSLTDFRRCGSVQVFPFVGYAGFYFGVLDGQTSSSVPTIDNGVFSPVIELGLALSIGLGKTISMGPLSGGITIAVLGMLKGVFA